MAESLSDKLKSLGVQLGTANLPPPAAKMQRGPAINEVVNGMDIDTPFGPTFAVQQDFPQDYFHGIVSLHSPVNLHILSEWNRSKDLTGLDLDKFVFIDTETSGLSGGTGTFAFMVGLGFVTETGFRLIQLFMRDPSQEAALIAALDRLLTPFEAVVTFNGKSFDVPLLKSRYILNNLTHPFGRMEHVDVLMISRRLWRKRLESCRLSNLEVQILGIQRAQEEVPGWMVPELYFDYLLSGDARPLAGVFYHNSIDILSLAGLFNFIGNMLVSPLTLPHIPALDMAAMAQLYEDLGHPELAIQLYERSLELGDMPKPHFIQALMRYAGIYKRQEDWIHANQVWIRAADLNHLEACVELAKYFEHTARNIGESLHWTERAIDLVDLADLGPTAKKLMYAGLQRRQERLLSKQNKGDDH